MDAKVAERRTSTWDQRAPAALPGLILLVAFGVFAVTKSHAIGSALGSGRAILLVVGFAAFWVLMSRLVLPRLVRSAWLRSAMLSAAALAVVVLVVLPYYRGKEVVETFPRASRPTATAAMPGDPAPATLAELVRITTGDLRGIDHSATGVASVYRQPDGSLVVELKDIDVESGPDYFVHVVPGVDREDPDGGANLGKLRGNRGTQYYEIPAGTEIEGDWTVLIWCRAFAVPVANATQSAV